MVAGAVFSGAIYADAAEACSVNSVYLAAGGTAMIAGGAWVAGTAVGIPVGIAISSVGTKAVYNSYLQCKEQIDSVLASFVNFKGGD